MPLDTSALGMAPNGNVAVGTVHVRSRIGKYRVSSGRGGKLAKERKRRRPRFSGAAYRGACSLITPSLPEVTLRMRAYRVVVFLRLARAFVPVDAFSVLGCGLARAVAAGRDF